MAIGNSGRIVIELDPDLKRQIHEAIRVRGLTLREWFLQQVERDLLLEEPQRASDSSQKPGSTGKQ